MLSILVGVASAHPAPPGPASPDPVAVKASGSLARKVEADPEKYVPVLVARLTRGTDDPAVKVRRIHDWIALNVDYDVARFLSSSKGPSDWQSTLTRGSAVCEGYAGLFQHLAEAAGLESRVVHGYARDVAYDPFHEVAPLPSNHAWNRVMVGEDWRLVDATWDAGNVEGSTYSRDFETRYLFPDPAVFARSHLPDGASAEDELLATPVDEAGFLGHGWVRPPLSADVVADPTLPLVEVGAETVAELVPQGDLRIGAFLERSDGTQVAGGMFTDRVGDRLRVRVRFPAPGDYLLHVGIQEVPGGPYSTAAQVAYTATAGSDQVLPQSERSWDPYRDELVEPETRVAGTAPRVVVRLPGVSSAALIVDGGKILPMVRDGDRFTSPDYDASTALLAVAVPSSDTSWHEVIRFSAGP